MYSPEHSSSREKRGEERNRLVQNWERSTSRLYVITLLICTLLICRIHHAKCQDNEAQAGIKTARRDINKFRYADDTTLMAESEEELTSHLMKVKKESEKVESKLTIQKTKIMASGSITSWQVDGKPMETMTDFIFLGS